MTITVNNVIDSVPTLMVTALLVVRVALVLWAVVGVALAAAAPAGAYIAEGKWSKPGWVIICLVAAVVFALRPTGFLGIIGIVAVGVFYADVRPAVSGRSR